MFEKVKKIDILIAIVAMYALYMMYTCYSKKEHMWASEPAPVPQTETETEEPPRVKQTCGSGPFVASNLLPKANAEMKESGFEFAPKDLQGVNFLSAQDKIGIDTVASSLRNANYSIRDEPANPKTVVSIWNQSTIESDLARRPLM
jgi:hypothetical protein